MNAFLANDLIPHVDSLKIIGVLLLTITLVVIIIFIRIDVLFFQIPVMERAEYL